MLGILPESSVHWFELLTVPLSTIDDPLMNNLFDNLPRDLPEELLETVVETPDIRIVRIVSTGQSSPPGFWYDQSEHEWIVLLSGSATLQFPDRGADISLRPGDQLNIPAKQKHRVRSTSTTEPTIWLAIFYPVLNEATD